MTGVSASQLLPEGLATGFDAGELARLVVADTSVLTGREAVPGRGGRVIEAGNHHLTVHLLRSICAGAELANAARLVVTDSMVDAVGGLAGGGGGAAGVPATDGALHAPLAQLDIEASTVLGPTVGRSLSASNAILYGRVEVCDVQHGCVRYSYLPLTSRAPRRAAGDQRRGSRPSSR